jgi:hypothetical protein
LQRDEKRIGMFNIPNDKFIMSTAIRDQGHENHFYGEQEIEKALCDLEGVASRIIAAAVEHETLPARSSDGHHELLMFTIFQAVRTRLAADETNECIEKFVKRLASDVTPPKENMDELSIKLTNAPAYNLGLAALSYPIVIDLRYKLLCNRTSIPFVTSDHPVVLYNQFMENRHPHGSSTGLASKGLLLFMPLSPRYTLVFFDPWAYKVGGRKLTSQRVDVTDVKDVQSLNLLQAVNANRHLFFNQQVKENEVRTLVARATKFRRLEKSQLKEYSTVADNGSLVLIHKTDVRTNLQLKCVCIPPHVERFELDNQLVHVRDRGLCALQEEFFKLVLLKKYEPSQFPEFLRDKSGVMEKLA